MGNKSVRERARRKKRFSKPSLARPGTLSRCLFICFVCAQCAFISLYALSRTSINFDLKAIILKVFLRSAVTQREDSAPRNHDNYGE